MLFASWGVRNTVNLFGTGSGESCQNLCPCQEKPEHVEAVLLKVHEALLSAAEASSAAGAEADSPASVVRKLQNFVSAGRVAEEDELRRRRRADAQSTHRAIRQFAASPLGASLMQNMDAKIAMAKRTTTALELLRRLERHVETPKSDVSSLVKHLGGCRRTLHSIMGEVLQRG